MARHHVSRMVPSLFHPEIAARNGGLPNAAMLRRIANAYNSFSTRQRKLLFLKWQSLRAMSDATAGSPRIWPCYFRTGQNVDGIDIHAGHAVSSVPGGLPTCSLRLFRASDDVLMNPGIEGQMVFAATDASGAVAGPGDISHVTMRIRGLAWDTEYYWECQPDLGMRMAYLMVHETMKQDADDSAAVVVNPARFVTEGPIRRADLQDLNFAAKHLWRHNASHLLSWCPNYEETNGPTTSSTSYVDLVVNSAAMRIETTNRGTLHRPNAIPVKIAVKAESLVAGIGTADFRLFDGTNSVQILGANLSTAAEWFTGTGTLSGTPANWRMQHRVSAGTETVRTSGFCAFQWEA